MNEQDSALGSFLLLGWLLYIFYILIKTTIVYVKNLRKSRKEKVKNLMFKLHKLDERQDTPYKQD